MNEQAVKELMRKGCIVEKNAAEELKDSDVRRIKELDSIPMYLSVEMLEAFRETEDDYLETLTHRDDAEESETLEHDSTDEPTEYRHVKMLTDCPDFIGTDMQIYSSLREGHPYELPADNAEILVNRGNAEWFEHELTVYESGSRKLEVTHDGEDYKTKQRKFNREMFVDAECTCGESFTDEEEAWNHVNEASR